MDNVLYDACLLSQEDWVQTLPLQGEEHVFSRRHQKSMAKLLDRMRHDKYHRLTRAAVRALVAAAVVMAMATTAIAFPGPRAHIVEKFSNHSTFRVADAAADSVKQTGALVTAVPEGFVLANETSDDYMVVQEYANVDQWLLINRYSTNMINTFDTEQYTCEEVQINGITYVLYHNDNINGVIWTIGDSIYKVEGSLPQDEIFNIAQNTR